MVKEAKVASHLGVNWKRIIYEFLCKLLVICVAPSRAERGVAAILDWFRGLCFVLLCKRESPPSIMVTKKPNWSFRDSKARDWLHKGKVLAPLVRPT